MIRCSQAGCKVREFLSHHLRRMDASSSVNDRFSDRCDSVNESHHRQLKSWLPPGYEYNVCSSEERPTDLALDHRSFEASFRMAITGVGQLKDWLQKLAHSSGVTWRVAVTKPSKAQLVLFKAHYRCQHNVVVRSQTANDRRLSKNTCCAAKMVCTLVTTVDKRGGLSRSKDPHVPTYPASVRVYNVHNHISVAEALRHRDVGAKAIETLTQLFEIGHNPTSALAVLKSDLLVEHGDKYVYVSANRALCLDLHFCYRLYQKVNKQEFGEQSGDKILQITKAFNLPQLFHLFTSRLESYYEARVTDVALGHWEAFQQSRFLATEIKIEPSDICQVGERKFEVKASTSGQTYAVDMELELCTCPVGHTGAPCKHQAAVVKNYKVHSNNFLPTTPEMRFELLKITGGKIVGLFSAADVTTHGCDIMVILYSEFRPRIVIGQA